MRIALVILHADQQRGGAERYTLDLARALLARGSEVTLLAADGAAPQGAGLVQLESTGGTRGGRYRSFCRSLTAHLDQQRYDVVHAMLPVPPGLCDIYHPHAGVAAIRAGSAITWWTNPRRRLLAGVERDLLGSPHPPIVLTLSQVVEDELRAAYPDLPPGATARLFNGVDLERFGPHVAPAQREGLGLEQEHVAALFVSNNFALKGLAEAIRALPGMDERLKLLVVGRDRPIPFQKLAREQDLAHRLHFLGGRSDLPALYRAADFLLLPTHRDSCSLVVLEALASGLPVISTVQNGATEIMTDGQQGIILSGPADPRLPQALARMLDVSERASMSQASLALRPALSMDHHLQTLIGIYEAARSRITS